MRNTKIYFITALSLFAAISAQNPIDIYLSGNNALTVVGNIQDGVNQPRDLDFHPTIDYQLWVLNQGENAYSNNSQYIANVCVPENSTLTFRIYDSYGDGWNGNVLTVGSQTPFTGPTNSCSEVQCICVAYGSACCPESCIQGDGGDLFSDWYPDWPPSWCSTSDVCI